MARLTDEQLQRSKPILSIAKPPRRERGAWFDVLLNACTGAFLLLCLSVLALAIAAIWWLIALTVNGINAL